MEPSFFTPVISTYEVPPLAKCAEDYFYFGGKKAYVINTAQNERHEVILVEQNPSKLSLIIKTLSYATVVVPLFMLITKAIFRSQHKYVIMNPKNHRFLSEKSSKAVQDFAQSRLQDRNDSEISQLNMQGGVSHLMNLALAKFYKQKDIKGQEEIKFNISELDLQAHGLALDEPKLAYEVGELHHENLTLREVVNRIRIAINNGIAEADEGTLSEIRNVLINIHNGSNPSDIVKAWEEQILQALVEKEIIFSFKRHGNGFLVQA